MPVFVKALLAAALTLSLVPADYTECKLIETKPIVPHTEQWARQPDFAALAEVYPKTMIFDGMPPARFRAPQVMQLSTGTVAACGQPPVGFVFEACVRDKVVHVPNPCDYPSEKFAILMCHEQAHRQGWAADHGE